MGTKIFTHISLLDGRHQKSGFTGGKNFAPLPVIENAYLVIEQDEIARFGKMRDYKGPLHEVAPGPIILPDWCAGRTGAFQNVAWPGGLWAVETPPTARSPGSCPTNRRQIEMHPVTHISFLFITFPIHLGSITLTR